MAEATSYIFDFDFTKLVREIGDVKSAYTDFGAAVRGFVVDMKSDVDSLKKQFSDLYTTINQSSNALNNLYGAQRAGLLSAVEGLDSFHKKSKEISETFEKISGIDISALKDLGKAGGLSGGPEDAIERIADVAPDIAKRRAEEMGVSSGSDKAEEALEIAKQALALAKEASGESEKNIKGAIGTIKAEIEGGKKAIQSIASSAVPGGLGSKRTIVEIIIALIVGGFSREARLAAEKGEMENVFESMTGPAFEKAGKRATDIFAEFGEKAQMNFGIGRKEVQMVAKAFVDAGFTEEQVLKEYNKSLGEIGENIPLVTLGLDKLFNLATGTTARGITELVSGYGDSLKEATDKQLALEFAAQKSGMGISKFVDAVYAGSQALQQYGIDVKDVAAQMLTLKKHYQDMGLKEQFAGEQAGKATAGIYSALANMPDVMKIKVGEDLSKRGFFGKDKTGLTGIAALNEYQRGVMRIAKGEDKGLLQGIMSSTNRFLEDQTKDRNVQILYLKKEMGMSQESADAFKLLTEKAGRGEKLEAPTAKDMENLQKALETEGKQMSELQKAQNDLIAGLGEIGKGLMLVVTAILGAIIKGFETVGTILSVAADPMSWLPGGGGAGRLKQAEEGFRTFTGSMLKEAVGAFVEGGSKIGEGLMGHASTTLLKMMGGEFNVDFPDRPKRSLDRPLPTEEEKKKIRDLKLPGESQLPENLRGAKIPKVDLSNIKVPSAQKQPTQAPATTKTPVQKPAPVKPLAPPSAKSVVAEFKLWGSDLMDAYNKLNNKVNTQLGL